MKTFGGPVLFLDRDDINTDEVIPARYLTEITKADLKPYLLEDLKLPGFDPKGEKTRGARVIVTRANFGCGSSREHAPWVLEVNANPCLSPDAGYAASLSRAGIDFDQAVQQILEDVPRRAATRKR